MQKPKQPDRRRYQKQRKPNDLSRCLAPLHSDHTLIAVVELSLSSWLVAGVVPGVERQPLKRLRPEPGARMSLGRCRPTIAPWGPSSWKPFERVGLRLPQRRLSWNPPTYAAGSRQLGAFLWRSPNLH